jgi:hypothetical protein
MPCTVRDASLVTTKNRGKALNAYYNDWKNSVGGTTPNSALTPPAMTSAEVVAEIREGCVACNAVSNEAAKVLGQTYDANVSLYPFNPSSSGASGLTGTS